MNADIVIHDNSPQPIQSRVASATETGQPWQYATYLLLLIPAALFVLALILRPVMSFDSADGFLVLRNMLQGGDFNYLVAPDPANIAQDSASFLAWWSPGQYLVPGLFVWLGSSYGIAMALTALVASVMGIFGWIQLARTYGVPWRVLFLFVLGLVTFRYTLPFVFFNGGEILLFAVSPWLLLLLHWGSQKNFAISFVVALVAFAVFFFAKLSGLFIFLSVVAEISLIDIASKRRLSLKILAIWVATGTSIILFYLLWLSHGQTPATAVKDTFEWADMSFPVAASMFSGLSAFYCLEDLYIEAWHIITHLPIADLPRPVISRDASYILGPLGALLTVVIWLRLKKTGYRQLAATSLTIVAFYVAAYTMMYAHSKTIAFEERYFYFVGMLSLLLLLIVIDQWTTFWRRVFSILMVGTFSIYGMASYGHEMFRKHHFDPSSGASMMIMSPAVLDYLRVQQATHSWRNAIVAVPEPEGAAGLPGYRILFSFSFQDSASQEQIAQQKWAGRADKVFVVLAQPMAADGKARAVLNDFVDYDAAKWTEVRLDGMVVFSQ